MSLFAACLVMIMTAFDKIRRYTTLDVYISNLTYSNIINVKISVIRLKICNFTYIEAFSLYNTLVCVHMARACEHI